MDLWFFLLLLGSGLISVGANNITAGKLGSSSLLYPIFRIRGVRVNMLSVLFLLPST